MADYVSIIAKAVSALADNTASNRDVIYQKARATIDRKLRAMNPPPAETVIAAQMQQLEAAIRQVEADEQAAEAAMAPPPADATPVMPAAPQAGSASVLPEAADTPILIDGIGDKTLQHLGEQGITKISQIAAMSDGELAALTERIGIPGFEKTQEWKEQASALLAGNPPRSKTDQERLKKILEEAGEASAAVAETPAVSAPEPASPLSPTAEAPSVLQPSPAAVSPVVPPAEPEVAAAAAEFTPPPTVPPAPSPDVPSVPEMPEPAPAPLSPEPVLRPESATVEPAVQGPEPASVDSVPEPPTAEPPVAARMEQPLSGGAPAAPAPASQPDYVSELDNDPALDAGPMVSRPVPPPRRKGGAGRALGWLSAILLVGAAGAGAYYYQDEVKEAGGKAVDAVSGLIAEISGDNAGGTGGEPEEAQTQPQTAESEPEKDVSRLGDGGETQPAESTETAQENQAEPVEQTAVRDVTPPATEQTPVVEADEPVQLVEPADSGNAQTEENAGEATGTADQTDQQAETEQLPGITGDAEQPVILAGEKAFLYEEGFGTNGASRDDGAISWTLANEPPEAGAAPEAVIKGVMEVPARGLQLNLTIKRNLDAALPASHIIELFFKVPPGFAGGNIDQISRFVMKSTEQARGESLVGVPARIDAGFFLIALNNLEQAQQTNLSLLETANWIDVPITYLTGRRGLVTLEKGVEGKKVFAGALADWRNR